ncbi:hypothetical protein H8F26_14760 [Synechococcus sp. CBW1006]|nr:hypothetical protein H8F26_14760 [Synechococcus sp. CBW1006]
MVGAFGVAFALEQGQIVAAMLLSALLVALILAAAALLARCPGNPNPG